MRILHVLDHSIPLHSGYAFRTLSILKEQRRLGWETFHLTSPKHGVTEAEEEEIDGWHFYRTRLPAYGLDRVSAVREFRLMQATEQRLADVSEQVKPQIIHAHSPVLNALPALRVGRRLGIPVLYEVRAFWEDAAVDHGTSREGDLRYRLTRYLETYALKRAAHVTTICDGLKREIVGRGVAASRVTVIPNAVDIGSFRFDEPADALLKQELGLQGRTVIGFIGSFYAYEGLDLLIEALPRILAQLAEVRLLLVGGGPHEATLRALVEQLGLNDKVVFRGRIAHGEVQRYYRIMEVLAYPRRSMRLTELVTPLKPLEAMAEGRLLAASNVGGHRELIKPGSTGVLFRADDADGLAATLIDLLGHPERWPALRANARKFVETQRNWTVSVAGYEPIYESLAARTRRYHA